ncbi:MAG: hypothetical protein RL670_496 [Actinomycetota bacterium]
MLKDWLTYIVLRIGIFGVVLALLLLIGADPLVAAALAAVMALAISLLFLNRQRDRLSSDLYQRVKHRQQHGQLDQESDIENRLLDEQTGKPKNQPK